MFLGHDYLDTQQSLKDDQPEGQDGAPRFVDPTQLLYDPTVISKNHGLKIRTDDVDAALTSYNSPGIAQDPLTFSHSSDLAIDPQLLMGDSGKQTLSASHTPAPEDWRAHHHTDAHALRDHTMAVTGGMHDKNASSSLSPLTSYGMQGYNVDVEPVAGNPPDHYGEYASPHGLAPHLSNYPGPNDVSGTYNPFVYQPQTTAYLSDPFLYATHEQPVEDPYAPHMLNAPNHSNYRQQHQLRDLNPNRLDAYDDEREAPAPKRKRPEKVRTAKPLTLDELEHDGSRFAKVVKALVSIEDPTKRTVPEIAKTVQDMCPGKYADFEAVKRMVNDVLQKHKAFYHNGRGSPYYLNLEEGRARKEFPSTRNARGGRRDYDEENIPPRYAPYGRRPTRYSRRHHRDGDLHMMHHDGGEEGMLMQDYMNSPLDDGHVHEQHYFR